MRKNLVCLAVVCTISMAFIFSSCNSGPSTEEVVKIKKKKRTVDERATDAAKAAEYEMNMLINPTSGKIPEGSMEGAAMEARQQYGRYTQFAARTMANAYIFQGPNNLGGRTRALKYDVRFNGTTNQVIIAGGVSGGIYKSTDNGATWVRKGPGVTGAAPFFTFSHYSVTSVAQDPRVGFQNTWYYSTGESSGNSASVTGATFLGNGIYKSTDNGETWARLASSNTGVLETFDLRQDMISKIIVTGTGEVYAAMIDGIIRSTDGGSTWNVVLTSGGGANTSMISDIVSNAAGTRLYASFSGLNTAAPTNLPGVWTSTTGASASWTKIAGATGVPSHANWDPNGSYRRVVLAIAPSNENILYALYDDGDIYPNIEAELYMYDLGANTWTDRSAGLPDEAGGSSGNDPFAVQGGYDLVISVKPDDANIVYIGGTNVYRSTDGFATAANTTRIGGYVSPSSYGLYANSHPDIHCIEFQPNNPLIMLCGNDGGIQRTTDDLAATVAWTHLATGYRTYQYYYVAISPNVGSNKVIGGAQDNGTTRNGADGAGGTTFDNVISGDGVSVGLAKPVSTIEYEFVGSQLGTAYRRNKTLGSGLINSSIRPSTATDNGLFVTLFHLDPDNTQNIYYASDSSLYRNTSASTSNTTNWTNLTGIQTALTDNAPPKYQITAIATTRGTYNAATASLFFGTTQGRLYRLDDPANAAAATAPVDITGPSFAVNGYISSIAVNPRNDDTMMVTFSNYGVVGVWWTGNANAAVPTWTNIEGGLTLPSYRSSAIMVTQTGVMYFAGTSVGLWARPVDATAPINDWRIEGQTEMGFAPVVSMSLRPADGAFLIGTHGYGMWRTNLTYVGLPVVLTEFKGTLQQKTALLQWTTSQEINSKHFELERSYDGVTYTKITTIAAAGTSNSPVNYSYTDREPLTENNYYRLNSVDLDGQSKLSKIVLLKIPNAQQGMTILGNPVRDIVAVRFTKLPKNNVELRLTNMSGQVVSRQYFGANQLVQMNDINRLSKGVYQLTAIVDGQTFKSQLVKQ